MREEFLQIKNEAISMILAASDRGELEEIKAKIFGKKGRLTTLLKTIPNLPLNVRPELGKLANEVKTTIEDTLQTKSMELSMDGEEKSEFFDMTLPGKRPHLGHLHPQTQVLNQLIGIFKELGYKVAGGPEAESDYYNFEALNIPKDHPSRDTQMTFYLNEVMDHKDEPLILRTQTSAMQGRIMEKLKPPMRVIVPGKCYRYEQVDASHGFEFWQLEGFLVDRDVRMTDLFGTLDYVLRKLFGEDTNLRFSTTNFPFVEPGVDTYLECTVCKGKGCSFCKNSGWSEIMPAGMIHPNVLKAAGINTREYNGFAFAIGLSRVVTLKYQMEDLRLLTNPDLRILEQF